LPAPRADLRTRSHATKHELDIHLADPLLQLKDIALSLDRHAALNGLNLSVRPGKVHALLGANGAGESGIKATLVVEEGRRIDQPVHLCFGLFTVPAPSWCTTRPTTTACPAALR